MRLRGYALLALVTSAAACAPEFDSNPHPPPRGTVGRELYGLACDRVGAQSLREDVTGASFHAICHPDDKNEYASKVDLDALIPLDPNAKDVDGKPVPLELQKQRRAYHVARIETMGVRREELIAALDATLPDVSFSVKNEDTCATEKGRYLRAVADTLSRLVPLHHDGTTPAVTNATGKLLQSLMLDGDAQNALARFDARQGYLPVRLAPGLLRPLLAYPRIFELSNALLSVISSDADPYGSHAPGAAHAELLKMFSVLQPELANASPPEPVDPLGTDTDPMLGRTLLSRPRTTLELAREVLLTEDATFAAGDAPRFIARRDERGYAVVPAVGGALPAPFVDKNGDGLPDVDPLGQFVSSTGTLPPSPFAIVGGPTVPRDDMGRVSLYGYVDASQTFVAPLLRDIQPLFDPDPKDESETVMDLLAGLPVVMGDRADTDATKTYPIGGKVTYKPFVAETSPVLDLVYAVGQIAADPSFDDTVVLIRRLVAEHPDEVARVIGAALAIKQTSDAHPEAVLPDGSTFWDELLDVLVKVAAADDPVKQKGVLEDLVRLVGSDDGQKMAKVFAAFFKFRDELTYDRNNLNGQAMNLTTMGLQTPVTPVDRTQPDTGTNRSILQRMLQLLHDIKGQSVCTKEGAIVHLDITWPPGAVGVPIKLDYPTSALTPLICGFVGAPSPDTSKGLPKCQLFTLPNLSDTLMDLILGKLELKVQEPCLGKLLENKTLTGIVGGADAVMEQTTGVKGFTLHPNINGFARLAHYDTAHDGLPGDTNPSSAKTAKFLVDVIDPIPTLACPPDPFPFGGTTLNLRKCATFDDSLRARDRNAIFPLEQLDFIPSVAPLARAFDDNGVKLLFVDLIDVLHTHWGTTKQSKTECDPTLPHTDARWCAQDGLVKYEPILVDLLEGDLFPALRTLVPILSSTTIKHCEAFDAKHHCIKSSDRDGVRVLGELLRTMIDPARNKGLVDRRGNTFVVRNDGTKNAQVTPIYLLVDALKAFDKSFATYAAAHPKDADRLGGWRRARSKMVDTFVSIDGAGSTSKWKNAAIPKIVPKLLDVVLAQVLAHCPDRTPGVKCDWAQKQFHGPLAESVAGPTFATSIDLLDAVRRDPGARAELQQLLRYLLAAASANDAEPTTLTALVDLLQVLSDDTNMQPFFRLASSAFAPTRDDGSKGVAIAGIEFLSRIFATAHDSGGKEQCGKEVDPDRAIATLLANLVRPRDDGQIPLFVIASVIADVNRNKPGSADKLDGADYANIAKESSEAMLDPASGLPQVYSMLDVLLGATP